MAKKRKTLPEDFQEIINSGDMDKFKAVFEKCEVSATARSRTTENAFSFKGLTEEHVAFLAENGIDLNADCGWGETPATKLADDMNLLKILIAHGVDINFAADTRTGNALFANARNHKAQAVENLLACGADPESCGGWDKYTALDESLRSCNNANIVSMVRIAKALLAAGAKTSDKTKNFVTKIGESFEFYRSKFARDRVEEFSDALDELYKIFNVTPVPRRELHNEKKPITVKSSTWQKQFDELWELLVPGSGHADTVQGEVIRVIGRITNEILDNGGANWDEDYRKMAASLPAYFKTVGGETAEKACALAETISNKSSKETLYQLTELAVKWVLENNAPIALEKADYSR